jgi:hypothetical protein
MRLPIACVATRDLRYSCIGSDLPSDNALLDEGAEPNMLMGSDRDEELLMPSKEELLTSLLIESFRSAQSRLIECG